MHQLVAYRRREVVEKGEKKSRIVSLFEKENFSVPSIKDLLSDPNKYLEQIPPTEREQGDIHVTAAEVFFGKHGGRFRQIKSQKYIPFDVDSMVFEDQTNEGKRKYCLEVLKICCQAMHIDPTKVGAICSGNGLQFWIEMTEAFDSAEYFELNREYYGATCKVIEAALVKNHVPGKLDRSRFMNTATMRVPETWNDKTFKGLGKKWSFVLQSSLEPQVWDWGTVSGLGELKKRTDLQITKAQFKAAYANYLPDKEAVLDECLFLKWTHDNPNSVSEDQWYAMIGILAYLPDGRDLCHNYSLAHETYSFYETEAKIDNHLENSGPRTCKGIESKWNGCVKCPHYNKITSPILITGPNYIKTQNTDFRKVSNKGGLQKNIEKEDLCKFYQKKFLIRKVENLYSLYEYTGKFWREVTDERVEYTLQSYLKKKADPTEIQSAVKLLKQLNLVPGVEENSFFEKHRKDLVNFTNGTLNWRTREFREHRSDDGFPFVLPYEYDPTAKCAVFDKFMDDVCSGDVELKQMILEFCGYAVSGEPYWEEKILWLFGQGSNGKSTLVKLMEIIVGSDNVSYVPVERFSDEQSLTFLKGKLLNFSEETQARNARNHEDVIKRLTTGAPIQIKRVYEKKESLRSTAKLIFTSNDEPELKDASNGVSRRYILAHLKAQFTGENVDKFILRKLEKELPGIFNILIQAYTRMREREHIFEASSARATNARIKLESNPVALFATEFLVEDKSEGRWASADELFESYNLYAEKNNYPKMNNVHFGRRLHSIDNGKYEKTRIRRNGKRLFVLKNYRLIDGTEEDLNEVSVERVGF